MDKKQANKIVKDTFENAFNKEKFVYFIKNLLNHIEETPGTIYRGKYIPDAYAPYVNTLERIGKYSDSDERTIDVLVINLKKQTSLARARTMQRNFIAWYLNGSRGGALKDAALAAFVSPDQEDWRFSLVKMEYRLDASGEKITTKKELTPARRFSFLVGKNENTHTAQSYLSPIMADEGKELNLNEIENAFSVEKVTKEFFEKYRELLHKLTDSLNEIVKKDKKIRDDFRKRGVESVNFTKKLLGQIVFLYFLQKKGWFGVERDAEWGTGPKNFLRLLFEKRIADYGNFFNDILEPLFYEALATERDDSFYSRFNCKIPFLNGGLFDPINNYDWVHTDIVLLNEIFSNKQKAKEGDIGTGILDVFDRYNFTVKEDEPLEKEVAVDPEMLGKVFENLLEVKDRKSKGTYYTPREIVHYMCQQSLSNYLAEELKEKVTKEDVETLVKYGETAIEHDNRVKNHGKETKTYSFKLSENIRKNAALIDEKLSISRVCDPAVGSGAFLVGMMNEIVRARNALTTYLKDTKERAFYDFKRNAIHHSLYGVDIDPGATEIAKLRLWLSLVVDEEDIKQIKPLPNLDYKIMQGNSLIEDLVIGDLIIKLNLDDLVKVDRRTKKTKKLFQKDQQLTLFKERSEDIFDELKKLHSVYFGENNKNKRLTLKERIDNTERSFVLTKCDEEIERLNGIKINSRGEKKIKKTEQQIKTIQKTIREINKESSKPFFLWKLNFSEVFIEKGGFDVVIANPPYLSSKNIDDKLKPTYEKLYRSPTAHYDIYIIFMEKGLELLRQEGLLTFITSNKYFSQKYGEKIRKILLENEILQIINFNFKVFEATVDTAVTITKKIKQSTNHKIDILDLSAEDAFNLKTGSGLANLFAIKNNFDSMEQSFFNELPDNNFRFDVNRFDVEIFEKSKHDSYSLGDICLVIYGLVIHNALKKVNKRDFVYNSNEREGLKLYTEGKYIARWQVEKYMYFDYSPEMHREPRYPELFENEKLLGKRIIGREGFSFLIDKENLYVDNTIHIILPYHILPVDKYRQLRSVSQENISLSKKYNLKFILALINSSLFKWMFQKFFSFGLDVYPIHLKKLPIKKDAQNEQVTLVKMVDGIQSVITTRGKKDGIKEYERQIDQEVYKIYKLTKEEIERVENFNNKK